MVGAGDVLEIPEAGLRLEIRRTAADTGGEYLEFDVVGRPRGLFARSHTHDLHVERLEVVTGAMRLGLDGRERVLRAGEAAEVPAGKSHAQRPVQDEPYHVRVQSRPPGTGVAFGERACGNVARRRHDAIRIPAAAAAARFVLEFGRYSHPAWPPLITARESRRSWSGRRQRPSASGRGCAPRHRVADDG